MCQIGPPPGGIQKSGHPNGHVFPSLGAIREGVSGMARASFDKGRRDHIVEGRNSAPL